VQNGRRANFSWPTLYLWVLGKELVSCRCPVVQRFAMASKYLENLSTGGVNQSNKEEICDSEHQFLYFEPTLMVKNQLRFNYTEESPSGEARRHPTRIVWHSNFL
jgi:hypothetical protein